MADNKESTSLADDGTGNGGENASKDAEAPKLDHLGIPGQESQPSQIISQGDSNNLSPKSMERQLSFLERSKTGWYQPSPPLGITLFEETFHLGSTFGVSVDLHITMIYYIIIEIIWSFLHFNEPLLFFVYVLIVLVFQFIALYFHMIATLYCAKKVRARIHRVILWPFGTMGYSTNYRKWRPLLLTLYMGPFIHILFIVIWVTLSYVVSSFMFDEVIIRWRLKNPMSKYLIVNVCNGSWVINALILVLNLAMPIYSFKAGRLLTSVLYRTRKIRAIADILLMPHTFMSIIILTVGTVDARPMTIFASIWSMYQTYLLWKARKLDMFDRLPMFNCLENQLRSQETLRKLRKKQEKQRLKHEAKNNNKMELINENENQNGNSSNNNGNNGNNNNNGGSNDQNNNNNNENNNVNNNSTDNNGNNMAIEITSPKKTEAGSENNVNNENNNGSNNEQNEVLSDSENVNNSNDGNDGNSGNGDSNGDNGNSDEFVKVDIDSK